MLCINYFWGHFHFGLKGGDLSWLICFFQCLDVDVFCVEAESCRWWWRMFCRHCLGLLTAGLLSEESVEATLESESSVDKSC